MRGHLETDNSVKRSTGIYRCIDDINNLKLRIRISEIINESLLNTVQTRELEVKTFCWQQRVVGKWERGFYREESNCVTDLDRKYHQEVIDSPENENQILYTYVSADGFCSQEKAICNTNNKTWVRNAEGSLSDDNHDKYRQDIALHIDKSARDPYFGVEYDCMHVMADFGEYKDGVWIKSEHILCKLKYDVTQKVLLIYPDFTGFQPYPIVIKTEKLRTYAYTVENASPSLNSQLVQPEETVLRQISNYKKKKREQIVGANFTMPPSRKLYIFLFCEILTARNFGYHDIHVRYLLELPEKWSCVNPANVGGSTQSCNVGKDNATYFGYPFDFILSCDTDKLGDTMSCPFPRLYFEIVSKSTWNRYRTEGLAYRSMPVFNKGSHSFELQCLRILPGSLIGNLKRFFIGDYRSHDDITWTGRPRSHEDAILNKFGVTTVGSGTLTLRLHVVHQSGWLAEDKSVKRREEIALNKLESSVLLKGAEQVIEAFKEARNRMIEARKNV